MQLEIVHNRTSDFVQIDKRMVEDPRLSWKAKGILTYLLSRPPGWIVRLGDIIKRSPNGKDAVQSAFKELKKFGYCTTQTDRDKNTGQLRGKRLVVYEEPLTDIRVFRKSVFPHHTNNKIYLADQVSASDGIFRSNNEYPKLIQTCVTKFENYIRKARKINPRFKRSYWLKQFSLLLQDIEGDKNRLRRVLRAYITLPHDEFTPVAECAERFRKNFTRIERWVDKHLPKQYQPKVIVTTTKATQHDIDQIPI